ncbi:MAG: hypothetical protein ACTHMM_10025 [Agriterribacter sp.]
MKEVKFVVATGNVDSEGDILKLEGMTLKGNPVHVIKEFSLKVEDHVGMAKIDIDEKKIMASMELPEELFGLTPAIGIKPIKTHMEGEVRVIDEFKLMCVALCANPNADPNVKTIGEQITE